MADLSQIKVGNTTYDIKDAAARSSIASEETARQNADTSLSNQISSEATARQSAYTSLSNQITALQGAVGSPLVASTVSAMTDTTKIYVYTGSEIGYTSGNWYYYDGSAWVSGGVYNSVAIETDTTLSVSGMPADAKTVGDSIGNLTQLNTTDKTSLVGAINEVSTVLSGQVVTTTVVEGTDQTNLTATINDSRTNPYGLTKYPFQNVNVASYAGKTLSVDFESSYEGDSVTAVGIRIGEINDSNQTIARTDFQQSGTITLKSTTEKITATVFIWHTQPSTSETVTVSVENVIITYVERVGTGLVGEVDELQSQRAGLFGNDLSESFTAQTYEAETDRMIARMDLPAGTYIMRWVQSADVQKYNIDARFGPLYKNAGGTSTYFDLKNSPWKKGEYFWLFTLTSAENYRFYFWGKYVTANVDVTEINLYNVDTAIGLDYYNRYLNEAIKNYYSPAMFKNIGFIGDSWTTGSLYDSSNVHVGTWNSVSFASQMCRLLGSDCTIFAKGGLSARTWLTDSDGLSKLQSTPAQELYWLNLGINDAGELTNGNGETDIGNPSDYANNVQGTFCYYYGRIIAEIKSYAPNAKIVMCDILQRSAKQIEVSNMIPQIAEYNNVPCVRMYDDEFYRSLSAYELLQGYHPTALYHSGMAEANIRLLAKCMSDNVSYFNQFTPSGNADA